MGCPETTYVSNREYLLDFNAKSARLHVPLSGSLDLTSRCNLRCVHCYTGDRSGDIAVAEMDTGKVLSLLDEISDAGCLYLLITGGEPLIRKDFPEIYRYAKGKGLLITVFTNGTLISDSIIRLFKDLPPRVVEISLYGSTQQTYESITGVKDSYEKCLSGIRRLLEHHINVRLKTILMTLNSHEFSDIEKMAKEFGVKFRFDAAIFPRLNRDHFPVHLRVPASEAIDKEFSDHERTAQWAIFLDTHRDQSSSDDLYRCGAGVTGFYIGPQGSLRPCLMTTLISYDLMKGRFPEGWEEIRSRIMQKKTGRDFTCGRCEKILFCGYCPAFFELENGDSHIRSEYLCALGNHRYKNLRKTGGLQNAK